MVPPAATGSAEKLRAMVHLSDPSFRSRPQMLPRLPSTMRLSPATTGVDGFARVSGNDQRRAAVARSYASVAVLVSTNNVRPTIAGERDAHCAPGMLQVSAPVLACSVANVGLVGSVNGVLAPT